MKFVENMMHKNVSNQIKEWQDVEIDLSVPPVRPLFNRKCMYNVVEELKAKRAFAILEVVGKDDCTAHYLCLDVNGKVYDPTLGWNYSGCKYKLVRYIHPEYDGISDMGNTLSELKTRLYNMLPWHLRLLSKVTFTDYNEVF